MARSGAAVGTGCRWAATTTAGAACGGGGAATCAAAAVGSERRSWSTRATTATAAIARDATATRARRLPLEAAGGGASQAEIVGPRTDGEPTEGGATEGGRVENAGVKEGGTAGRGDADGEIAVGSTAFARLEASERGVASVISGGAKGASASTSAATSGKRFAGSRSRQRRMTASSSGGRSGRNWLGAGGRSWRTREQSCATVSATKGVRPAQRS